MTFCFLYTVPNQTCLHYFLIVYSATDSFISLEKGCLQLFRIFFFHELLKQELSACHLEHSCEDIRI